MKGLNPPLLLILEQVLSQHDHPLFRDFLDIRGCKSEVHFDAKKGNDFKKKPSQPFKKTQTMVDDPKIEKVGRKGLCFKCKEGWSPVHVCKSNKVVASMILMWLRRGRSMNLIMMLRNSKIANEEAHRESLEDHSFIKEEDEFPFDWM